jgi:multicomponent Na+:H+ antiporter subunit B
MIRPDIKPWGLDRTGALVLACCGLLLYAGIGLLSFLFAGNYLDYGVLPLPLEAGKVRFVGSFGIEVGVSMSVTGVLILIFDALTEGDSQEDHPGEAT